MNEPVALQRVSAKGALTTKFGIDRTRIDRLFQEGAAKIRVPKTHAAALEAVLINTAGGLTGGDRLQWEFAAGPGCGMTLTTQASEKVYRAGTGRAETMIRLIARDDASLSWLPQETILFNASALHRTIEVDASLSARLLMVEPLVFGRTAMGEAVSRCAFHDDWRIRVDGKLVHAESFRAEGEIRETLERRAIADGATALATVLLIAPEIDDEHAQLRTLADRASDCLVGVSALHSNGTGKLLARLVASNGYWLRRTLVPLVGILTRGVGLPKIWAS